MGERAAGQKGDEDREDDKIAKLAEAKDRGICEHGIRPWYNCERCCESSTYHFGGNFR